jgi:hypothetical protein
MLTNSNMDEMNKLLGERVMDRMRLGNSLWVIFNWDSYRIASPAKSIKISEHAGVILKGLFSHAYESVYEIAKNGSAALAAAFTLPAPTPPPGRILSPAPPASSAAAAASKAAACPSLR